MRWWAWLLVWFALSLLLGPLVGSWLRHVRETTWGVE